MLSAPPRVIATSGKQFQSVAANPFPIPKKPDGSSARYVMLTKNNASLVGYLFLTNDTVPAAGDFGFGMGEDNIPIILNVVGFTHFAWQVGGAGNFVLAVLED